MQNPTSLLTLFSCKEEEDDDDFSRNNIGFGVLSPPKLKANSILITFFEEKQKRIEAFENGK